MLKLQTKTNPVFLLIAFVFFVAITHYYSIYQLSKQNLTGLDLSYDYEKSALVINTVSEPTSRLSAIPQGTVLFSLSNKSDTVYLSKNVTIWAQEKKDRQALENYLTEHERIYNILQSDSIIGNIGRQDQFTIITEKFNSIASLPIEFWIIRIVNTLALLICIFIWIYKPNTPESYCMILAGFGYYLFGFFYSITAGSEITIKPDLLGKNIQLQSAFLNIFALGFFTLLTQYPKKILGFKACIIAISIFTFTSLCNLGVLPDIPVHNFFLQFFLIYLICIIIAFYQWHANKRNPIKKASIIALQISLLLPAWIIILLYFLPIIYDENPIINHFSSHIIISSIFLGWAIGILKFRLFEVERWWFRSWLWVISTALIICMDLILIYLFNWEKELTTALTIIIIGFIYFPIRQLVFSKTLKINEPPLQESLVGYFEKNHASEKIEDYDNEWLHLLKNSFHAIKHERLTGTIEKSGIENNGLHLHVSSLCKEKYYKLSGKQQGNRLFNKKDAKFCQTLFNIVLSVTQSNLAKQKIKLQERKRVMDDLHDNLGAMLLTMTYNADSRHDKEQALNALRLLRDTVYFSSSEKKVHFVDLLNRSRFELDERLKNQKTITQWDCSIPSDFTLTSEQSLAISYIQREAYTNAIKHANPDHIKTTIRIQENNIHIKIANNHNRILDTWKNGVGINSIKRRCKSIDAQCQWSSNNHETCLELAIPF